MNSKPTVEFATSFLSLESEAAAQDVSDPSMLSVAEPSLVIKRTVLEPAPVPLLPIIISLARPVCEVAARL